ncbi:MAG TPA: hypothetical protein DEQ62_06730, partial [Verrucomicrobiales bacterium]|nr:hypothetical protein [Verrucomicrobiales bacterium]
MAVKDDYLLDTLMDMGAVDPSQVEAARAVAEPAGAGVIDTMVISKTLNPDLLVQARGMQYGCDTIDLRELQPNDAAMGALPRHIARRYQVIPVAYENDELTVALEDPGDIDTTDALNRLLEVGLVVYKVASESQIKATIDRFYGSTDEAVERLVTELSQTQVDIGEGGGAVGESGVVETGDEQNSPLVKMVNLIIADGFRADCSDVHIEPFENRL